MVGCGGVLLAGTPCLKQFEQVVNADDTVAVKVRVDVRCSPGADHEHEIIQVRIAIAICIGTFGGAFVTDGVAAVVLECPFDLLATARVAADKGATHRHDVATRQEESTSRVVTAFR